MKRFDILFLVRSLQPGGAERQLVLLARTLHQQGISVAVAQFYGGGLFADELKAAGVPLYDLRKRGRWSNLQFLWRLLLLLRRMRPKIAHGYLSTANLILLLFKPWLTLQGTAVVCGVRASGRDLQMYDAVARCVEKVHRRSLRLSDAVVCNSDAGLRHVSQGLRNKSRFHVVNNGVDADRFSYTETGRLSLRAQWSIAEEVPVIGLVGRHDPVKGHALFLSAAKMVAQCIPSARFVIVGSEAGSVSHDLRKQADKLNISERVIWDGHRSHLAAVYSALDILVLCSYSEGFPNVVAEGMSCGLPCVCTDVGDVRRVLGNCGWVIEGFDPSDLAGALQQAVRALPTWDRERPRCRVIEHFSVDKLAHRTLSVLAPYLK